MKAWDSCTPIRDLTTDFLSKKTAHEVKPGLESFHRSKHKPCTCQQMKLLEMKHIGEHSEIQRRYMKGWLKTTEGNRNADKKVATRRGPGLEEVSIFSSFTSDRLCSALPSKSYRAGDLTSAQPDFLMLQQRCFFQARLCSSPLHYLTPPHIHVLTALLCSSRFLILSESHTRAIHWHSWLLWDARGHQFGFFTPKSQITLSSFSVRRL